MKQLVSKKLKRRHLGELEQIQKKRLQRKPKCDTTGLRGLFEKVENVNERHFSDMKENCESRAVK